MAVPKRRVSKTRAAKRRTHYRLKKTATIQKCPSCGAYKKPHTICPSCGEY
ncbi:MAG: 50S ribosomal protein L32 [Epsilonproteobacteria bacterium]|jgi:large subunit ribosomal protein L32|nr:50S ribosomal protein L32 [Campylobacterota bacterium]